MCPKNKKNLIKMFVPIIASCFVLFVAGLWGHRGDRVRFFYFLIVAIVVALPFPGLIVAQKLDERFDRLEEILKDKKQVEKKEDSNRSG